MKALFISEKDLKDDSSFNENIDGNLAKDLIFEAQETYILPLLGSLLYKELVTQITTSTVSANNVILLKDYIQQALKRYIRADAYIYLNYRLTNKAVNTNSSANSTPISLSDAKELHSMYLNKAEFFGERLVAYLKANYSLYPLYYQYVYGELNPQKVAYDCGIYLGDSTSNCESTYIDIRDYEHKGNS